MPTPVRLYVMTNVFLSLNQAYKISKKQQHTLILSEENPDFASTGPLMVKQIRNPKYCILTLI